MPKRVQVIEIEDRNPFGEETDPSQYHTDERDALYIEGYSDKRKAFELAVGGCTGCVRRLRLAMQMAARLLSGERRAIFLSDGKMRTSTASTLRAAPQSKGLMGR